MFSIKSKDFYKNLKNSDEIKYIYLIQKNNIDYCYAIFWNSLKKPIIYDIEFHEAVIKYNWQSGDNLYAYNTKSEIYMHRFIAKLAKLENYEDDELSIDHINCEKLDNRIKNIRMATQSQQNSNRHTRCDKKPPCKELQDIGIKELPKYIRYDNYESKFIIEKHPYLLIEVQNNIRKKPMMSGTKSSKLSILEKYQDILSRLEALNQLYINKQDEEFKAIKKENYDEYNEISNLINKYENLEVKKIEEEIIIDIEPKKHTAPGKKTVSKLPPDCGVKHEDIPKYCWYRPETKERGDKFIIEGHPNLTKNWTTTESKKKTTLEKFKMMMEKYNELNLQT